MDSYDPNKYNELARQQARQQYTKKDGDIHQQFNDATDELKEKISNRLKIQSAKNIIEKIHELEYSSEEHAHYALCKEWIYRIKNGMVY